MPLAEQNPGGGVKMSLFDNDCVERLAEKLAEQYRASCTAPTWRGAKGEKEFRGITPENLLEMGVPREQAYAMVVDLAATPYSDLPEHWQDVNREAARGLLGELFPRLAAMALRALDLSDEITRGMVGAVLHSFWLEHNAWAKGGELDVPFAQLPRVEQDKDIAQIEVLRDILR